MSERRHELQKNELADVVATGIERVKPYSQLILAGCLAAVVAIALVAYFWHRSNAEIEQGYDRYFLAMRTNDPDEAIDNLQLVVDDLGDTIPGLRARLAMASFQFNRGVNTLFDNREEATEDLESARDHFKHASEVATEPEMKLAGLLGLARTLESLDDLEGAKTNYEAVVSAGPDSSYAKEAELRLRDLNKPATVEFYSWLAQQKFEPLLEKEPGTPGVRPGDLDSLDLGGGNLEGEQGGNRSTPPAKSTDDIDTSLGTGLNPFGKEKEKAAPADSTDDAAIDETPAGDEPASDASDNAAPDGDAAAEESATSAEPVAAEPATGEPATDEVSGE